MNGTNQTLGSAKYDLRTVMDACPVGIVVFGEDETVLDANAEAKRLFAKTLTAPGAVKCGDFLSCANRHKDPRGCGHTPDCPDCALYAGMRSVLSSEADGLEGETFLSREPGYDSVWVTYKFRKMRANGSRAAVMTIDDRTTRKQAEEREAHIKRVLLAIRDVTQLMIAETDPRRLIEQAAAKLTGTLGYYNAWIALLDASGVAAAVTASSGLGGGFDAVREELKGGRFPQCMRRALETDDLVVIKDPSSDCPDCLLAQGYAGRAGLVRRLSFQGRVFGILCASIPRAYADDTEEHELFDEMARDLAFALHHIEETERAARRQSEIRATLYGIGDGVISADRQGRVVRMNPVAEHLTGWTEAEARGRPVDEVFRITQEQTRAHVDNPVARVLSEGAIVGLANHTLLVSKDGKETPVADSAAPVMDSQGQVIGAVLVFRDQAEERLGKRLMETRLAFFEYAQRHTLDELLTYVLDEVSLFVDSPIGFFHFVNPDQKTLFLQQWSSRTLQEFCSTEGKGMHYGIEQAGVWVDCVHAKRPVIHNDYSSLPHRRGMPEGHAEVVRELTVPVMRDNKVAAIVGVGNKPTDYTEKDAEVVSYLADVAWEIVRQKRFEEENKRFQTMLQRAQKMEAVGTLAAGIAHDFNNILTPVIIQTELALLTVSDDSPMKAGLQEVLDASHRAKELVKQILAFSRHTESRRASLTLAPIIKEVLKLLRSTLPATIDIQQETEIETGTVLADPTQIHQVLMNLCTNAAHAMREKGGILKVRLSEVDIDSIDSKDAEQHPDLHPGKYARISVGDTGPGIEPSLMERIFEPFFTTKDRSEGTGMGLSVVHGIAKSCGGDVHVETEPGKGTTFHTFFPVMKAGPGEHRGDAVEIPKGTEHVLVVDDEQSTLDSLLALLKYLGYRVTATMCGMEALKVFRTRPDAFDLVIADTTMPKMRGDELAQELIGIRPDIPIILCTGYSDTISEEKAKAAGVKEVLMKPIAVKDTAKTVRRVLDHRKTTPGASHPHA